MKSKQYKGLLLFVALFLFVFSCQEPMEIKNDDATLLSKEDVEFKAKLESAAKVFGKVFHSREAQQELIGFSLTDGNDGEVHLNLRTLFENESMRSTSSIIKRLNDLNNPASRGTDWDFDDFNYDDFIAFISENDISIIAPYLAENFQPEVIERSLTVSFYTDDMNRDVIDPAYHTTPGYYIDYGVSSPYLQPVVVDDNYAYANPTIVLGRFDNYTDESVNSTSGTTSTQSSKIVCSELKQNGILTLKMPHFRMHGNLANWPWANHIHLWAAFADFTTNSVGNPQISARTPKILSGRKVSRKNARNQNWIGTNISHIIQDWKLESKDLHLIWGYEKNNAKYETSVTVSGTGTASATTKVTFENGIRHHASILFDKCPILLNNVFSRNDGHGVYNSNFTIYRTGQMSMYFTTEYFE
ncbi:MAG TPA: hypothetical protein PLV21_18615 [Cyclobacteriaceae bacterium]|nr:hypothetical protein [Cyclobacteriaceae bacterium]HRJ83906.1 hypothetical protein [Cyclobacteriaceae bacterium]